MASTNNNTVNPLNLLTNIINLVPFKLDSSNYIIWRYQISSIFRTHSLFGFLDGSKPCPSQFLVDETGHLTTNVDPEYQAWIIQDQALITLLNATLSENALAHVVGKSSSREVWLALKKQYSSLSCSNILQLKSNLQTITKKSDSVDVYMQKIKTLRDKLTAVSVNIDDEDMLLYTLNGLPPDYNAFRTAIRTKSESISFEELHAFLRSEEQTLEATHSATVVDSQFSAMATSTNSHF